MTKYFLSAKDLQGVPHGQIGGGIGCGGASYTYRAKDCLAAAIRKFGSKDKFKQRKKDAKKATATAAKRAAKLQQ